jgi:Nif-specific regulatory protein
VESVDDIRFLVEVKNDGEWKYIEDAKLVDVSSTGMGFSTLSRYSTNTELRISLHFKRLNLDLSGQVVRSFTDSLNDERIIYGVEVDKEDQKDVQRFLETYINNFSSERLRDCLVQVALSDRYARASEGFEMFSLILSLFKDMTNFGEKQDFLENMLEEVTRVMNAQRASIFVINPDTNELEAVAALGIEKELLKFDYRKGIAGSVFTTGVSLNIDIKNDSIRFSEEVDRKTGFETRSVICCPIYNREDKNIGVIEVLNKRNEDRFNVEDEKTMKVLALIFSSVFHNYNPISEQSRIRRFSTPFDRENVLIGRSQIIKELRNSIVRLKDVDAPLILYGEDGVGKTLIAKILHEEGTRGVNPIQLVQCRGNDQKSLEQELFGEPGIESKLEHCQGGTLVVQNIDMLPFSTQKQFYQTLKNGRLPNSTIQLDVRIIVTSSFDLRKKVEDDGSFCHDLFHLLNHSNIQVGPLRKRKEDVEDLIHYFMKQECKSQGLLLKEFSPAVMDELHRYDWPGNIEEVREAIEKAVLYNPKAHIISNINNSATPIIDKRRSSLGSLEEIPYASDHDLALKDRVALVERKMIFAEIKRNNGNKSKAAKAMGISREALRKKLLASDEVMERLGLNSNMEKMAA